MSGRSKNSKRKYSKRKNLPSNGEITLGKGENQMTSSFNSEIKGSIQSYKTAWEIFDRTYKQWSPTRKHCISELKKLAKEVKQDQMGFNNLNITFKKMNVMTRKMKTNDDSTLDTFASFASFVTDMIGGINSIAQACNVDKYMEKFGDIMEQDAEVTKRLYEARSNCFDEYRAVEEIIRRYHSDTFGDTFNKITENMRLELKSAHGGNSMAQVAETIDVFLRQLSRVETLNDIRESVVSYVDSNPAVLEACKSTGRALYGIYDTWGYDKKNRNSAISRNVSMMANNAIISSEEMEICQLRRIVDDESEPQAEIERKILEAISDFEKEEREMRLLFETSTPYMKRSEELSSDYARASHFREEYDDYAQLGSNDDYDESNYAQCKSW